jgi:DNA-binding XRE family transcriptional regulator
VSDHRFWDKVEKSDGCHHYLGYKNQNGYGWVARRGTQMHAHRWAWILTYGEIPEGLGVLHKCDNPLCCNPEHLFLGTHKENMDDRDAKGRQPSARGEKNHLAKLNITLVKEIRSSTKSAKELASLMGVSKQTIWHIRAGRTWASVSKETYESGEQT